MLGWLKRVAVGVARRNAMTLYDTGNWSRAVPVLQRVARERPDDAGVHYRLGDALYQLDRVGEALGPLARAVKLDGGVADHHYKHGNVLKDLDRPDDALAAYRRALEQDPAHAQALTNIGVILEIRGDTEAAVEHYRRALQSGRATLPAYRNLATLLARLEHYPEAVEIYDLLLEMQPDSIGDWCNLGNAYLGLGRYEDAVRRYERALALDPDLPELLNNIGAAYRQKGELRNAWRYFERALEAAPGLPSARINLANARYSLGYADEALERHRAILKDDPDSVSAARQILMILMYQPGLSAEALFEEHRSFARKFPPRSPVTPPKAGTAKAGGKLRIGYVSSDLRRHPVGYNMMPVVEHHDRSAFEVYLYSSGKSQDEVTQHFRRHADAWRSIAHLPDEAAARMMREDRLDLLVLLAGRFDENRPLLATYRAAPVQVSMHDTATSGLEEVDYLIADRNLSPSDTPERYTERVACLPTFYLHAPLELPPPSAPPVTSSGSITFGSFNNPAKINADVVNLWARVLHDVPGSRLLLKYMDVFGIDEVRARYLSLFEGHGIGAERLVLPAEGALDRHQHLARYGQIDIALDTFPFSGSTTTFEALSMGVPVITLAGDRMVSRWSAAMLRKVGLSRLVARTEAEYVELAAKLAANREELARLRAELRERVPRSPLCAVRPRVRQLERLYRAMCARHAARKQ